MTQVLSPKMYEETASNYIAYLVIIIILIIRGPVLNFKGTLKKPHF